jgi:lipid II:glycine glycyltransferase (peptidoglycan interpeptide bridge formation enzyme)
LEEKLVMPIKRYKAEQIVTMLRQIEVSIANGKTTPQACKEAEITMQLTLRFKDTVVYKYGGSDPRFHASGGVHALFWRVIQDAKREGLRHFDLGRSDLNNQGLITFKDRWGSIRSKMVYFRYPAQSSCTAGSTWSARTVRQAFAHMPNSILSTAGKLLYKHVG